MSLEWEQAVVDAEDPEALGRWWLHALDWVIVNDDPDEFEIRPEPDRLPGLIFEPVGERKHTKNRIHLDLRPDDQNVLGAQRVSDGTCSEHGSTWILIADPEGNESCICDNGNPASDVTDAGQ